MYFLVSQQSGPWEEITLDQRIEEWGCSVSRIWTQIFPHLGRLYYRDRMIWVVAKNERFIRLDHLQLMEKKGICRLTIKGISRVEMTFLMVLKDANLP